MSDENNKNNSSILLEGTKLTNFGECFRKQGCLRYTENNEY